ncbi:Glycosyltransferase [Quillaja saponaria]|uniref:Glycosyltransferase n=1 Tax=Quillaja saponaria TaxID=32244 RepID=A0AAD7PD66_QUISA|nr:Glycosyltransferase [Quillaja saponaria]WEU75094.1 UGT73CX1 [Quillaja saponaria]
MVSGDDDVSRRPLKVYFIAHPSPGHIAPLTKIAHLFAALGEHVTILTTPANVHFHEKSIDKGKASGYHVNIHTVKFPSKEVGLPDGIENFSYASDVETAAKIWAGFAMLQTEMEQYMELNPPDCIVADMFTSWTSDFAIKLGITRIVFNVYCIFTRCLEEAIRSPDSPHLNKEISDNEPFVIPGLPDPITITRAQLPDGTFSPMKELARTAELKSFGMVINGFSELETDYIEHYKKIMGHKRIWHVGPLQLIHRNDEDKIQRSHKTAVLSDNDNELVSWLNSKKPDSVIYICFGSATRFSNHQLYEIACGLEASGHPFLWGLLWVPEDEDNDDVGNKWLPAFEERIKKENKGMILRGWAPQMLILNHPAIGGFMTHCGWNAAVEALSSGVPIITFPVFSDQFYNERLISQVHKCGVGVGTEAWSYAFDAGKNPVGREKIMTAVKKILDGGEEAEGMRKRARELKEIAKRSVEEGGSSYNNLTAMIQDLKEFRANNGKAAQDHES